MSYNRTLVAALFAGAASITAVAAHAQDAAPFAGPYVGIVGGNSEGRYNAKDAPLFTSPSSSFFGAYSGRQTNSAPKFGAQGWELGGTVGWNYQSGNFVAGYEGDVAWSGVSGQANIADRPNAGTRQFSTQLRADTKYTATARGRLGYAFGPVLAYGTAGFALQNVNYHRDYTNAAGAKITGETAARSYLGFAYGAGAEYAMNQKVSVKAEYLRLDTGSKLFSSGYHDLANSSGVGTTAMTKVEADRNLYRIGFNYHF